jgi:hypothetical protein
MKYINGFSRTIIKKPALPVSREFEAPIMMHLSCGREAFQDISHTFATIPDVETILIVLIFQAYQ